MALADRNYMRERREPVTDFMPPRSRRPSTLTAALVGCAVLAGLYVGADHYLALRDATADARQRVQAVAAHRLHQQAAAAQAAAQPRKEVTASRLIPNAPNMPAAAQAPWTAHAC